MPFRFSLKWLLIFTAYLAFVIVAITKATPLYIGGLSIITFISILFALVLACFSKDYRAIAVGFAIGAMGVLFLCWYFPSNTPIESFVSYIQHYGNLDTQAEFPDRRRLMQSIELGSYRIRGMTYVASMLAGLLGSAFGAFAKRH